MDQNLRPVQDSYPLQPMLFCSLLFSSVSMLLIDVFYHFVEFKTCDTFVLLSLIIRSSQKITLRNPAGAPDFYYYFIRAISGKYPGVWWSPHFINIRITHADKLTLDAGTTKTRLGCTRTVVSHETTRSPRRNFPGVAPPAPQIQMICRWWQNTDRRNIKNELIQTTFRLQSFSTKCCYNVKIWQGWLNYFKM